MPWRPRAEREAWSKATAHNRAQILYYIAENLSGRREEFAGPHRGHDRASKRQAAGRGRRRHQAALHLWRLGRQI